MDYESLVEQVYKCIHCPKGSMFTHQSKHSLKLHMKTKHRNVFIQDKVTGDKDVPTTFLCKMCKKYTAPRKEEVIEHLKNQHNQ